MTIEHVAITDPEIHEPKGASTAANKSVYYADGAGSGSWTLLKAMLDLGWEFADDDASGNQVITTTAAKLQVDAAGAGSILVYLPPSISGSDTLWDGTADKVTPIAVGDVYIIHIEMPVTATSGSPTRIIIQFDVGGAGTPTNVIHTSTVPLYKAAPFDIDATFPVWVDATFLANGGQIFLSVDAATSATILNPSVFIQRTYRSI